MNPPLYTIRPISDRTAFTGPAPRGDLNPFSATWSSTLEVLAHELDELNAERVVLEIDVREQDLRVDGTLRATARAEASPAVRLAFESPHGPLVYATDRYGWTYDDPPRPHANGWQQNVRAIALGLESLRRIDRYGITRRGEQYRGFRALPPGTGLEPTGMTVDVALEVLARESRTSPGLIRGTSQPALVVFLKKARAESHPDRNNGDRSRWNAVDQAEQVLRRAGRIS